MSFSGKGSFFQLFKGNDNSISGNSERSSLLGNIFTSSVGSQDTTNLPSRRQSEVNNIKLARTSFLGNLLLGASVGSNGFQRSSINHQINEISE